MCCRMDINKPFFDAAEAIAKACMAIVGKENDAEVEFDDLLINWIECYSVVMRYEITDGGVLAGRWDSDVSKWCFIDPEIHNLTKEEE